MTPRHRSCPIFPLVVRDRVPDFSRVRWKNVISRHHFVSGDPLAAPCQPRFGLIVTRVPSFCTVFFRTVLVLHMNADGCATAPGHDDAMMLILACFAKPPLNILGVSTVAGNMPLSHTTTNALKVLRVVCASDIGPE
jgi:hypothetical protein